MTYIREIAPDRFRVQKDKQDTKHRGVIERHEYTDIQPDGTRSQRVFWIACGIATGWRDAAKKRFETRDEAAEYLLQDGKVKYQDRKMEWDPGHIRARKKGRVAA